MDKPRLFIDGYSKQAVDKLRTEAGLGKLCKSCNTRRERVRINGIQENTGVSSGEVHKVELEFQEPSYKEQFKFFFNHNRPSTTHTTLRLDDPDEIRTVNDGESKLELVVYGLHEHMTPLGLYHLFQSYGPLESVDFWAIKESSLRIRFRNEDSYAPFASNFIDLHTLFDPTLIFVNIASCPSIPDFDRLISSIIRKHGVGFGERKYKANDIGKVLWGFVRAETEELASMLVKAEPTILARMLARDVRPGSSSGYKVVPRIRSLKTSKPPPIVAPANPPAPPQMEVVTENLGEEQQATMLHRPKTVRQRLPKPQQPHPPFITSPLRGKPLSMSPSSSSSSGKSSPPDLASQAPIISSRARRKHLSASLRLADIPNATVDQLWSPERLHQRNRQHLALAALGPAPMTISKDVGETTAKVSDQRGIEGDDHNMDFDGAGEMEEENEDLPPPRLLRFGEPVNAFSEADGGAGWGAEVVGGRVIHAKGKTVGETLAEDEDDDDEMEASVGGMPEEPLGMEEDFGDGYVWRQVRGPDDFEDSMEVDSSPVFVRAERVAEEGQRVLRRRTGHPSFNRNSSTEYQKQLAAAVTAAGSRGPTRTPKRIPASTRTPYSKLGPKRTSSLPGQPKPPRTSGNSKPNINAKRSSLPNGPPQPDVATTESHPAGTGRSGHRAPSSAPNKTSAQPLSSRSIPTSSNINTEQHRLTPRQATRPALSGKPNAANEIVSPSGRTLAEIQARIFGTPVFEGTPRSKPSGLTVEELKERILRGGGKVKVVRGDE